MNNVLLNHSVVISNCYVEMTKKAAQGSFILWLESKDKSEQKMIRNNLRAFGWYIVKRRSGEYQLMERLTIKNAPEKFLERVLDEIKLCLENEPNEGYEVNLGYIEQIMPAEIVRVKNVPQNINVCVLMV